MQAALRSTTRRAVAGISSRRGVAATTTTTTASELRSVTRRTVAGSSSRRGVATTTKASTATASEDRLAEHEKAWVKAMVQRQVRAQMAAEEERRIARDRLRAVAAEERPTTCRSCRVADGARLISLLFDYTFIAMQGCVMGAGLALLLHGRV